MAGKAQKWQLKRYAPAIAIAIAAVFFIAVLSLPASEAKDAKIEVKPMPHPSAPVKECENGEVLDCESDSCPGKKVCQNGFFSDCSIGRKVCAPRQRIGCNIDGCRFGYMVCNECGTMFGNCIDDTASKTPACTGSGCG